MCKLGGGANRCEAHWGPTQKAADLARRRAKYAAKKGGNVRAYTKQDAQAVLKEAKALPGVTTFRATELTETSPVLQSPFGGFQAGLLCDADKHTTNEELNIVSSKLYGSLVDSGYYSDHTVNGSVNWDNLDEESYRAFGFDSPGESRVNKAIFDHIGYKADAEVSELTTPEINALALFSGASYGWINEALYNRDETKPIHQAPMYSDKDYEVQTSFIPYDGRTATKFGKVIEKIDSAMEKAPRQQRIVYRGLKREHIAQPGETLDDALSRLSLGQEMVFDGYQSSSYSPSIASNFSYLGGEDYSGVMLEVRTSSGINMSSISDHGHEKEVLLPRNARYMVVGIHKNQDYKFSDFARSTSASEQTVKNAYVIQIVEVTENGDLASADNVPAAPPALTAAQLSTYK